MVQLGDSVPGRGRAHRRYSCDYRSFGQAGISGIYVTDAGQGQSLAINLIRLRLRSCVS